MAGDGSAANEQSASGSKLPFASTAFEPVDYTGLTPFIHLPGELWLTILSSPCTFSPDIFSDVMLNLINNPNITSSYLFRADVYYDSDKDYSLEQSSHGRIDSALLRQIRPEYRPIPFMLEEYQITRTIVRKLIPRNPQLDNALVQTCHFLSRTDAEEETTLLVYIPHVQNAESMPFYHPSVSRVAFVHRWRTSSSTESNHSLHPGSISISYTLFPNTDMTIKLERTALRLLQTAHKHGQGQLAGYEKRVHLDQIIPQRRYQDTYTRLKAKYGKHLAEQWVEATDPSKHVFEDIGIAAFLIELWRDMYSHPAQSSAANTNETHQNGTASEKEEKASFPGFVDIGCGNGVLVYLLLAEGYPGWGFDARDRKTWKIFPNDIQQKLHRRILVPHVLQEATTALHKESIWHNGIFEPKTFIISNHADELTVWTPLLAYLNRSPFVAIPCCSHDFTGARFRAPASVMNTSDTPVRLPQQAAVDLHGQISGKSHVAESGSLRRTVAQQKMLSAYSTLCSYVASLTEEVGLKPEKDVLRIPSTRNQCVLGRSRLKHVDGDSILEDDNSSREQKVIDIVQREMKMEIGAAATSWIEKVEKLSVKPKSGH